MVDGGWKSGKGRAESRTGYDFRSTFGAPLFALEKVRFSHNWTPEWWNRFANSEFGMRNSDEETRGICAAEQ